MVRERKSAPIREPYASETPEVLEALFPSADLKLAFQNLNIKTSPEAVEKLLDDKKRLLLEVLQTGLLPKEVLKTQETIYISSGIDIEYPLCLGSRKITLVDPALSEESVRSSLVEKIKLFDPSAQLNPIDNQMNFSFDFGQGKEDITVSLEPRVYRKEQAEHHKEGEDYVLPAGVGMILGFRTQDATILDEEVKGNLVAHGIILVDDNTMPLVDLVEARKKIPDYWEKNDHDIRREVYVSRGYKYVPLKTNEKKGWTKSFLIKN